MSRDIRFSIILATLLAFPTIALSQGTPVSGAAIVSLAEPESRAVVGEPFDLELTVDLRGVSGTAGGESTPAVLAGIQIEIVFDPDAITFQSSRGGNTGEFNLTPITTSPGQANSNGRVVIVASHSNATSPTGLVSVAHVTFLAEAEVETMIDTRALSLSSALQVCCGGVYGPASIPSSGTTLSVIVEKSTLRRRRPVRRPDTNGSAAESRERDEDIH